MRTRTSATDGSSITVSYPAAKIVSFLQGQVRVRSDLQNHPVSATCPTRRSATPASPHWVALLPGDHADGYPSTAAGTCQVLIGGRLYPVIASVNSAHTILDAGQERTVEVGDTATLIGPDDPAVLPHTVSERTGVRFLALITKLNARVRRRIV